MFEFFNDIANVAQSVGGLISMSRGSRIQIEGYRSAGAASMAAARYNAQLDQLNTARELDNLSRQITRVSATQRAQAGASGLKVSSKSFLSTMSNTLSTFERAIIQTKASSRQRQQAILFEGRQAEAVARNQAASIRASSRANIWPGVIDVIGQVGTLFGGLNG